MARTNPRRLVVSLVVAASSAAVLAGIGQGALAARQAPAATGPRFYPDDPVGADDDRAFDASKALATATGDIYDFVEHTFLTPGERVDRRAMNVNTLDEVPDSSWFTNRIGRRPMSREAIVRGPDRRNRPDIQSWPIVAGKYEGRQPGYRVRDHDEHLWQIEFDPPAHPEMASAAEVIGTAFYHALGYNVVEVYVADLDPAQIRIAPNARMRSPALPGGVRAFTRADLDDVLARAARRPDGRVRVVASRFADGSPLGSFRYDGTRPDDPNDVFPHEHRRELRANRVFAAWLNHDDSRGLNSLDMLERAGGRSSVTHYMFDFGSIMGSGTVFAQKPRAGHEYIFEGRSGILTALTFGLYRGLEARVSQPRVSQHAPRRRLLGRPAGRALLAGRHRRRRRQGRVLGPGGDGLRHAGARRAPAEGAGGLVERRDPAGGPELVDGVLRAANAAVANGVADPPRRYVAQWFVWNNAAGTRQLVGSEVEVAGSADLALPLPVALASRGAGEYIGVTVAGEHPAHAGWAAVPVTFSFRRTAGGWEAVGITRERRQETPE
jgi:hypothetical protein